MVTTLIEDELLDCPCCPNQGWFEDANVWSGELEQVQCEFCYMEPQSKFNAMLALQKSIEETANFYEHYKMNPEVKNKFSLVEHSRVVSNIILKLVNSDDYYKEPWFIDSIIKLTDSINDIANNSTKLEKKVLATIIPFAHVLEHIRQFYYNHIGQTDLDILTQSINQIIEHLYGTNKEHIIVIAKNFDMLKDPNYWQSCIENQEYNIKTDSLLPTF